MPDREKVIEGLKAMHDFLGVGLSSQTQVFEEDQKILEDAIALLKKQESVKPVRDTIARRFWVCGNCGEYVGFEDDDPFDSKEFDNYCRRCGKPVLWEGR